MDERSDSVRSGSERSVRAEPGGGDGSAGIFGVREPDGGVAETREGLHVLRTDEEF